jgi:hypothetical protein
MPAREETQTQAIRLTVSMDGNADSTEEGGNGNGDASSEFFEFPRQTLRPPTPISNYHDMRAHLQYSYTCFLGQPAGRRSSPGPRENLV